MKKGETWENQNHTKTLNRLLNKNQVSSKTPSLKSGTSENFKAQLTPKINYSKDSDFRQHSSTLYQKSNVMTPGKTADNNLRSVSRIYSNQETSEASNRTRIRSSAQLERERIKERIRDLENQLSSSKPTNQGPKDSNLASRASFKDSETDPREYKDKLFD